MAIVTAMVLALLGAEQQFSTCWEPKPYCYYGTHPTCVCQGPYNNCHWVCSEN